MAPLLKLALSALKSLGVGRGGKERRELVGGQLRRASKGALGHRFDKILDGLGSIEDGLR